MKKTKKERNQYLSNAMAVRVEIDNTPNMAPPQAYTSHPVRKNSRKYSTISCKLLSMNNANVNYNYPVKVCVIYTY